MRSPRGRHLTRRPLAILEVNAREERLERDLARLRLEPVDAVELVRPEDAVRAHVPLPAADVRDLPSDLELLLKGLVARHASKLNLAHARMRRMLPNRAFFLPSLLFVAGIFTACVGDAVTGNGPDSGTPTDSGSPGKDATSDASLPADAGDASAPVDSGPDGPAPLNAFPTHATATAVIANAGDLVGPAVIDTSALTIQMVANGPAVALPANAKFVKSSDRSILSVGAFTVSSPLLVKGSLPLVVVASGAVSITATITANGVGVTPGPGGIASGSTSGGAGGLGTASTKGGGGGGYGSSGGAGGGTGGGTAGTPFSAVYTDLFGGAPGGKGSGNAGQCGGNNGIGGAGGGALSIASPVSIDVSSTGKIHVGGGGGAPGCNGESAPGGGSGGLVFLEAPTITIDGLIASNGGGGGGGSSDVNNGNPGSDATLTTTPANGGPMASGSGSGKGGNGAAGSTAATAGTASTESGGGGGGLGRVRLRYRTAPVLGAGTVSGTREEYSDL